MESAANGVEDPQMKRLARLIAVAAVTTAMLIPAVADASHSWGNYHWERASNPVSLEVGNNVSPIWVSHLNAAVADWNQSKVLDLTVAPGAAKGRCKATTGRIEVCSDSYGPNGWLGLATIYASGDHITAATTKVNDTYFALAQYDTAEWRQMVMCQEIGHDFGLAHQDENFDNPNLGSCMDYTSDPSSNQHPNQHDYDLLESIYGHLDAVNAGGGDGGGGGGGGGCKGRNPNCFGADGDSAATWGQLVSSEGRHDVYVQNLGNGNRIITFVTWAD